MFRLYRFILIVVIFRSLCVFFFFFIGCLGKDVCFNGFRPD